MTITEARSKLRNREISALELAQESLRRIHEAQPRLNAFITITAELALEQARRADDELAQGIDRGPLHGIPYALKDNFETRGIRTTCGSKIFADYVPDRDSAVCERYREAGAVLMGKTGMHELAYGITSDNPHFGTIHNPHDLTRSPGGSSGGSGAAVTAGLVFFSIGSDTGGSIRIPAAWCGCVGFKPTFGLLDTRGLMPLGPSFDTAGPLTRTVEDAALVMGMQAHEPLEGVRIGVAENFFGDTDYPGAVRVKVPDPEETNAIGRLILMAEASAIFRPYLERRGDFGPDVLALLDQGMLVKAVDYVAAQRRREVIRCQWDAVWNEIDIFLTPTVPIGPPLIGGEEVRVVATKFVRPFNVLGFPAVAIAGLQVIGKPHADAKLLQWATQVHPA
jgi:aspartyl-tRNA(Asn)/glutamyl-tRNA(Gln) amidotransferase subunit A